jgi:hypothetical protein
MPDWTLEVPSSAELLRKGHWAAFEHPAAAEPDPQVLREDTSGCRPRCHGGVWAPCRPGRRARRPASWRPPPPRSGGCARGRVRRPSAAAAPPHLLDMVHTHFTPRRWKQRPALLAHGQAVAARLGRGLHISQGHAATHSVPEDAELLAHVPLASGWCQSLGGSSAEAAAAAAGSGNEAEEASAAPQLLCPGRSSGSESASRERCLGLASTCRPGVATGWCQGLAESEGLCSMLLVRATLLNQDCQGRSATTPSMQAGMPAACLGV